MSTDILCNWHLHHLLPWEAKRVINFTLSKCFLKSHVVKINGCGFRPSGKWWRLPQGRRDPWWTIYVRKAWMLSVCPLPALQAWLMSDFHTSPWPCHGAGDGGVPVTAHPALPEGTHLAGRAAANPSPEAGRLVLALELVCESSLCPKQPPTVLKKGVSVVLCLERVRGPHEGRTVFTACVPHALKQTRGIPQWKRISGKVMWP